jgi:hypothetical protein
LPSARLRLRRRASSSRCPQTERIWRTLGAPSPLCPAYPAPGTTNQIAEIAANYLALDSKGESVDAADSGYYLTEHSALTYLMGQHGQYLTVFG